MDPQCCVSCFSSEWLRNQIRANSTEIGVCDYCGSVRRHLLPVGELAGYMHNLVNMYEEADDGDTLISLVQEWAVFSERLQALQKSEELLQDILNSDWDDDSGTFPVNALDSYRARAVLNELETWEGFCLEVREDPDAEPEFGDYFDGELAAVEKTINAETILYRARLGWAGSHEGRRQPFTGADIGAPPPDVVTAGRANRAGRSVLYCAEDEATAVAEVRPARGFWVSTCRVRLLRDARILDLVDGIPSLHPFTDDTLAWSVQFSDLLHSFAEALSTPLARRDDVEDYRPSQKLCEYVERLGYDGVRYPSAMHDDGRNIVLFSLGTAEILESRLVEVTSVEINFHER